MLRTRRQGNYVQLEEALCEALCDLWPAKNRRDRLRIVAMASIGALRLAVDAWLEQDGKHPLAKYVRKAFKDLKAEV